MLSGACTMHRYGNVAASLRWNSLELLKDPQLRDENMERRLCRRLYERVLRRLIKYRIQHMYETIFLLSSPVW